MDGLKKGSKATVQWSIFLGGFPDTKKGCKIYWNRQKNDNKLAIYDLVSTETEAVTSATVNISDLWCFNSAYHDALSLNHN